jgi:hypothetical protein
MVPVSSGRVRVLSEAAPESQRLGGNFSRSLGQPERPEIGKGDPGNAILLPLPPRPGFAKISE